MDKEFFTVEDFVLDASFRNWILFPDSSNKEYWAKYLQKNPTKYPEIIQAKKIVLNLARKTPVISKERLERTWDKIHDDTIKYEHSSQEDKTIPLNAETIIRNFEPEYLKYRNARQIARVAAVFVLGILLSYLIGTGFFTGEIPENKLAVFEDFYSPAGVKSSLTMSDGSKVILNSGSHLRYLKKFESDQRVVELDGEAFFEVAKDSTRPFKVKSGIVTTTAIGTSFNVKAYRGQSIDVSLTTGEVEVAVDFGNETLMTLLPGEAASIDIANQRIHERHFKEENVMAWTQKTIYFEETPFSEIKWVLENWYGVEISLYNVTEKEIYVSGKFKDQTLKNVLDGLSYSARFDFEIENDQVKIYFK